MVKKTLFFTFFLGAYALFAQGNTKNDDRLLTEYIQSKGPGIILFDASNIKQYWIDKTVLGHNSYFEVSLNENKSVPLRLKIINVNETQDCKVEIIANSEDFGFNVLNNQQKVISSSVVEDQFINYNIVSSTFHLEDAPNTTFDLVFNSKKENDILVKKIILSFSENKNSLFLSSPGILKITNNNTSITPAQTNTPTPSLFSVTGKRSRVLSNYKILTSNTPISSSATIKNTGDKDARIYIGYAAYTNDQILLSANNYPYKNNNKVLNVISVSENGKKILVDSYSDWAKDCYLALNVKEDMSDIPNTSLAGQIIEIKQLENSKAEITLKDGLKTPLKAGEKVRVHGMAGAFIYTSTYLLHPGEEKVISSSIKKDNSYLEYSSKAFSRGTYYAVPLLLSYSVDANEDNTIVISDFTISY